MPEDMRTERDLLGDVDVPARALYGVHAARAVEIFPRESDCSTPHSTWTTWRKCPRRWRYWRAGREPAALRRLLDEEHLL